MTIKLYLDDVCSPPDATWTPCRTVAEAQSMLLAGVVDYASLDHDLGMAETSPGVFAEVEAPTGYDLCKWMAETGHWPGHKPTVHSANPVGRAAMIQIIERFWMAP